MGNSGEISNSFTLYVTCVEAEGPFVKICGQTNKHASVLLERSMGSAELDLRAGKGVLPPGAVLTPGALFLAQYKDGGFYRARILEVRDGMISVLFIDYGNRDLVLPNSLRSLEQFSPQLTNLPGLTNEFVLARAVHPLGRWDDASLAQMQRYLINRDHQCTVEATLPRWTTIIIATNGGNFVDSLAAMKVCAIMSAQQQAEILNHLGDSIPQVSHPHLAPPPTFTEHVVPFANRAFPSNPASTMRMQNLTGSLDGSYVAADPAMPISTSAISQRLLAHRSAPRNVVNLRPLTRQPFSNGGSAESVDRVSVSHALVAAATSLPTALSPGSTSKSIFTYRTLEVDSDHRVCVSFARDGPDLFAVQLSSETRRLQEMMNEINKMPHRSLTSPATIGTVCLGRMSGDRMISRAIVMNVSAAQCQLFFVDFGDTELVSYYDIYDIPEQFLKPSVFAMRFVLSGMNELKSRPELTEAFRQLTELKVMTLRVVPSEGPPLTQYGELIINGRSVKELLKEATSEPGGELKRSDLLPVGSTSSVMVSYVDSCIKFFIQLSDNIDSLNEVMAAVETHCKSSPPMTAVHEGSPCCALFPDDGLWYRAEVVQRRGDSVLVCYVDYGNEQEVPLADLRAVTSELLELPAQALKCALKGFEDKPVEPKTSNQLEMLALERTLRAHVFDYLSEDVMLVSLVHDGASPPLDIARRMVQLSQPPNPPKSKPPLAASSEEVPPGSPEVTSPESDKADRNRFRSDRFFKDDRRRDDLAPYGGSFRGKDKPGGKQWERNNEQLNDDWDEPGTSARSGGRDNFLKKEETGYTDEHDHRDRRDNWSEKREGGDNKGERRDGRNRDWGEKKDSWGDKKDNWGDKKDNWGEKKDSWSEKKDSWGGKRERPNKDSWSENRERKNDWGGRDNRKDDWGEKKDFPKRNFQDRGDRKDRSNFTPKDRAERSFDNNRSFDSNKNVKELADPVSLETSFANPDIEIGSQLEVAVSWFISPESFFSQITSHRAAFTNMMNIIPEMYKGVKCYSGTVNVGSSVLARFPEDRVLYRATVLGVQPFGKYIVQYVDFGNKYIVDSKDIWQLDRQLIGIPKMAVHCSLMGVKAPEAEWSKSKDMDLCFNAPCYQCVFQECVDETYGVSLWNNGVSVAEILAEKRLSVLCECSSVTLKDKPIDLPVVVGQELMCLITHVESFQRFQVQLDLEKAALVENTIAALDRTTLQPLPAESVLEGTHCTLTHEGQLYRGILEDAADESSVKAQLPDYGYSVTVPATSLYVLPTELSVYYYQSLTCRFNNYEESSSKLMTEDELVAKLKGNKFILYINDIDGVELTTTVYERTGAKVAAFEPDEGAYESVSPLCPRAVFNYNFGAAYLVHAENLGQLYLQKASDADRIADLLDQLFKFYEEGTPEDIESYDTELCVAKSSDGNWYRATVISAADDTCKVQFIDYGNTEEVVKTNIKKLDPTFYEPNCLALVVSLGMMPLQDNAVTKLTEMLADIEVLVTLTISDEGWLANLNVSGEDISLKLVKDKIASPVKTVAPAPVTELTTVLSGTIQVYISHVDTPGQFWLQMADKVDKIEEIQAELQEKNASYPELEDKEMGTLCVAKYSGDDMWYRAEVLDSDTDIITVRFIDYGNTDVLDNIPGVMKVIPGHLKEEERFAIKSSVNAVPTGTGQWSEPSSDYFTELVGDMSAPVQALIILKDVTTYVDLFVNGENLTDKLVADGHATRSDEMECGDLSSCFASHVNSPSEFWIQLENAAPELQAVEEAMADAENFPELTSKEEGTLCAAKYPEDGCWYRAQIIVEGSEGFEVLFMDYGNASIVTELRSMLEELKTKPALSRKCALQKPRVIKAWSRKSEVKFNEMAAEGATIFKVQFIASGDISIVELYLEGKSVTEELATLCEAPPATERPSPLGQDLLTNGTVCHANSPTDFYVQLESDGKITDKMSEAENFEEVIDVKLGSLVAAFWDEDEQWYRAKVIEFCDVGSHVIFLDYGNKAKCEKFRQLPTDLSELEPLAKHCALAAFNPDEKQVEAFLDIVSDTGTAFQIEFLDTTKEPRLVKLLLNGDDVCSIIKKLGVPVEEKVTEEIKQELEEVPVASTFVGFKIAARPADEPVDIESANESAETENFIDPSPIAPGTIEAETNSELSAYTDETKILETDDKLCSIIKKTIESVKEKVTEETKKYLEEVPSVTFVGIETATRPADEPVKIGSAYELAETETIVDISAIAHGNMEAQYPTELSACTDGTKTPVTSHFEENVVTDQEVDLEVSTLDNSVSGNITIIENQPLNKMAESLQFKDNNQIKLSNELEPLMIQLDESGPIESEEFKTPRTTPNQSSEDNSPTKKGKHNISVDSTACTSDTVDKADEEDDDESEEEVIREPEQVKSLEKQTDVLESTKEKEPQEKTSTEPVESKDAESGAVGQEVMKSEGSTESNIKKHNDEIPVAENTARSSEGSEECKDK